MTQAQKHLIKDCKKDLKYYNPLLRLINADLEDEKICENLTVATDYLTKAIEVLEAVERLAEVVSE